MKRFLSLFLALVFVFGAFSFGAAEGEAPAEASEASLKWRALDHDYVYYLFQEDVSSMNQMFKYPETLNMREEDVVITLGSYDKSEYDRYYNDMRVFRDRIYEIDRDALLPEEQYAYDALRTYIEWDLAGEEFYGYFEPLAAYSGIQADLPIVFWLYDIRTEKDAETYLALLATVPEFMGSLLRYEQYRVELGVFMPEAALDKVQTDNEAVISSGEDIFLIASFESALDGIPGLSGEKRAEMEARNRELVRDAFIGGYQMLYDGLEKLRPYCMPAVGIAELDNEAYSRFYAYFLRITCGDDVTVEGAADLMEEYIVNDWNDGYNALLAGGEYFDGKLSIGTVEENMQYLRELNAETLPEVPDPNIKYVYVPEKMRDVFPPAAYLIAAFDDPSDVVIVLNEPEQDSTLLRTLSHEGWYGHLYQYAGIRGRGMSLSQQFIQNSAYSEAFSQMGEYFFVTNTQEFDNNSLMLEIYEEWMQNEMITYCSILVNGLGYSLSQLKTFLKDTFGYDGVTAEAIYEISVQVPFYYMPYTYGLARFRKIFAELGYSDWKTFYEDCFAVGPTFFHLLEKACEEIRGVEPAPAEPLPGDLFGHEIPEEEAEEPELIPEAA